MAVTNTGIVLRTITGVNESDLFLDSEATSATTNTGIVERSIVGVHDANFVRPLGDEEITNGGFDTGSDWILSSSVFISGGTVNFVGVSGRFASQDVLTAGRNYKLFFDITEYTSGVVTIFGGSGNNVGSGLAASSVGSYTLTFTAGGSNNRVYLGGLFTGSIDNVSVKEMLVTRESTTTNTGIVERAITGSNESELWLDAESTSVVTNTGIIERPITGVNVSDALFPDNTESTVVNISDTIIPLLTALEARATTFENREGTQNILINLEKC